MSYITVTTKRARDWWIRAMREADNQDYLPTVFVQRDGRWRSWRIQNNNLGNDAIDAINSRAPKYAQLAR